MFLHYSANAVYTCTCLEKFRLEFLSSGIVEFLSFNEALGHALEVLLRDRSVLVEVDPLKVGLHLADPEVRHDCGESMLQDEVKTRRRYLPAHSALANRLPLMCWRF